MPCPKTTKILTCLRTPNKIHNVNKILLTGGTGFVGQKLCSSLVENGYRVAVLSRESRVDARGVVFYEWDVENGEIDERAFEDVWAIVHLAGASIGDKRWTDERKREIVASRVETANLLHRYVVKHGYPIETFISSSAVGFYGAVTTDEIFTESSASGSDFLASVCGQWEHAAMQLAACGCRVVILRLGVVIGPGGGVYDRLGTMVKRGVNPSVGRGEQYLPWIDVRDVARLIRYALEHREMVGIYNAVASEQITMNDLRDHLQRSLGKKSRLPNAPAFAVKLLLGEMAKMILEGSRVSNDKVLRAGFDFDYDTISQSLGS